MSNRSAAADNPRYSAMDPTFLQTTTAVPATVEDLPPQHLLSDYVEMAYLGVVILVGTSINLHILFKLIQEKKKNSNNKTMVTLYNRTTD